MVSQTVTLRSIQKVRPEQRIIIAEEEFGDDLIFYLQDKNGNAFDLTDKTPILQVWSKGLKPFIDKEITVIDPATNGQCKYNLLEIDFGTRTGTFYLKVLAKTNATKREAFETILLVVQE